ncbi:MAG: hypothetical protein JWP29_1865 [Rhodoferax sp.]|nr:hypothetical protein [Rhodoferax sp.]
MPLPLEGIRVLDLGISTAGPYAARFLADLGADVVKVEPLAGENARSLGLRYGDAGYLFHVNNYNKRSLVLKVQDPRGRQAFLDLVAQSDVVIENFAVGTMDGWGIGFEACRAANPSIVYCSAKGFGESGVLRNKRAFDTVVQGLAGLMDTTGSGADPLKGGPSVCDLLTAAASVMATVSAITDRGPGESVFVDTALFDMGAWSLAWLWPVIESGNVAAASRLGNRHPHAAPFGSFACSDGELFIAVEDQPAWAALAAVIGADAGWTEPTRKAHEGEIDDRLAAWLGPLPKWDASARLQAIGVAATPVLLLEELSAHPLMTARTLVTEVDHPQFGKVPLLRSPLAVAGHHRPPIRKLQPPLGHDTAEVVGGLPGGAHRLATLRDAGVVAP